MREIKLTNSDIPALIDDEDYSQVIKTKGWRTHKTSSGNIAGIVESKRINGKYTMLHLHRFIMELHGYDLTGKIVDHKNHNVFDNRKENLRICSYIENNRNRKPLKTNLTKYKGVYPSNRTKNPWIARINIGDGKKSRYLGIFKTEELAAEAYDKKAKEHFGEFAWLNFP